MSWGSVPSTSPPPRAITRTSSASLPIWSARVWCVAWCPGPSRWAAVCGAWKGAGSWTCRGPPRCCSGCIAAGRPPPGRGHSAGWTCRRRAACWDTSSHTTPSPRRCARLIRRAPTGRSRCGMRSWPTRRTRPPAGAPPTTDPRSSEHDRPTDVVRRSGAASLPARGPRGSGRPRAVRVDAGADHAVLGHIGIHRGRAGARHPASARQPVVRADRAHLGLVAARGGVRDAHQPAGGVHERDRRRMLEWVPARLPRRLAAVAGALAAATAFTVWNQSVVNEKVYTLSLLSIALVLWLIVRWDDQP